jgi:predicted transcriptional regulator of viral defense system
MPYKSTSGISARNRSLLEQLHRTGDGPLTVRDAARLWKMTPERASRRLRSLAAGGWLTRPRRGLYVTVPLEAERSGDWREDPWLIAAKLFPTGYIGGWSAAEHWELTDQVFRDVLVFTPHRVAKSIVPIEDATIRIKLVSEAKLFGLQAVWRSRTKIRVSDASRTIVDLLNEPATGGGIRHAADVVEEYLRGRHRSDALLIDYADRFGNRAVFKRLGFMLGVLGFDAPELTKACAARISKGVSLLDPGLPATGRIVTRWNLRVNAELRQ